VKGKIEIDVRDMVAEAEHEEAAFANMDELVDWIVQRQIPPQKSARLAIGSREAGMSPEEILPANKILLVTGTARHIGAYIENKTHELKLGTQTYHVRDYIGRGRWAEGDETTYVPSETEVAQRRVEFYLLEIVPGHVVSHMAMLHEQGGDVRAFWQRLRTKLDSLVENLIAVPEAVEA